MRYKSGFTLIEMVVGIVVLASAMVIVTGVFLPQASQALSPMYQIRSTALAKSIMNQVLVRNFDSVNANTGGYIRCGESVAGVVLDCTDNNDLGIESGEVNTNPTAFNDVDDYHVYCDLTKNNTVTTLSRFTHDYPQYGLRICVTNDPQTFDPSATAGETNIAKIITLTIYAPNKDEVKLSAYRGNY